MQLELEACLDEINWVIRCHNCEVLNCPQEDYPARHLPIPPDDIDAVHFRLIKVKKDILSPTLKIILKTHYPLQARPAPITPPTTVQPDDMLGEHRGRKNSPQEQPRASEEEEKMVPDDTSSTDEGGIFFFSNRGRGGPQTITTRRSPFRTGDVLATPRDNKQYYGEIKNEVFFKERAFL